MIVPQPGSFPEAPRSRCAIRLLIAALSGSAYLPLLYRHSRAETPHKSLLKRIMETMLSNRCSTATYSRDRHAELGYINIVLLRQGSSRRFRLGLGCLGDFRKSRRRARGRAFYFRFFDGRIRSNDIQHSESMFPFMRNNGLGKNVRGLLCGRHISDLY